MGLFNWLEKRIDLAEVECASDIVKDIEERLSTKALAFYIGASYYADVFSKCEIKHFVNGEAVKDKWYYLLNVSPNINQSAFELKSKMIHKALYDGEALIFENKGNLYLADSFNKEERPLKGDLFTEISLENETKTFTKRAEDVFYINFEDGKLKQLVYGMLDDYTEIFNYSIEMFKSSNSEKYKLIMDELRAGDKDFNEKYEKVIKKQLEVFINSRKAVYPQFKGYNLEKMDVASGTADASNITDLRKEIFEITAEAFKMPVSMLYGNMTNVKDIVSSFITFGIDPKAKFISEELTRKTGTYEDYSKGTYFDVDTTAIMHQDIFEIADKVDKMISSGVYCIDEIRAKLGENPLDTDFSKQHWITKNYSTVEDALKGENQTVSAPPPTDVIETEKGGE